MFEPTACSDRRPHGHDAPHHNSFATARPASDGRWLCSCGRLLGTLNASRLRLKPHNGDEYLAAFPTTCKCRKCGAMNEVSGVQDVLHGGRAAGGAR